MLDKKDIQNRNDIEQIMRKFYDKLLVDDSISHYFDDLVKNDRLEHHFEILTDFWDNILFFSGAYQRNAMAPHIKLSANSQFTTSHFDTWLRHLNATIDEGYEGEIAHNMKTRALSIATVMKMKTGAV